MIIHLESTEAGFKRMKSLFESGEVTEVNGLKILSVSESKARVQGADMEAGLRSSRQAVRIPVMAQERDRVKQPLSAVRYATFSFAFLTVAAAFACFYLFWAPKMGEGDGRVYFLVLIVWGLLSASFLAGAMRGYASVHQKHLGTTVLLSGPIAVFILVVGLGMKFAQSAPSTFDLTVRPSALDGKAPLINSGTIVIDLDNDRRQEEIGNNGEANFKDIPGRLRGVVIPVLVKAKGYKENWQKLKLTGPVLEVPLEPVEGQHSQVVDSIRKLMDSEAKLVLSNSRDAATAERYGALFADNATISDSGPPARTWRGRKEIIARFRGLERFADLRHKLTAEPSINSDGSGTAEAVTEFLMENPGHNQNPNGFGRERWTFVKEGDQWKIQSFRYNVP
jgi:hypothetical protein